MCAHILNSGYGVIADLREILALCVQGSGVNTEDGGAIKTLTLLLVFCRNVCGMKF